MRIRTATTALLAAGVLALSACSSSSSSDDKAASTPATSTPLAATAAASLDTAPQVVAALEESIPTLSTTVVYTEASDPNHLLGRPSGYTSKVAFADSRVSASDVEGLDTDAIERGGSVETYATAAAAHDRAEYIEAIAKGLPAAAEYHYFVGGSLIRVSRFLTPTQAKVYEQAAAKLS